MVKKTIQEGLSVYGAVAPVPGALITQVVDFESRIRSVFVSEGETVAAGERLATLEPSADALLQYNQTEDQVQLLQKAFDQVKKRLELKLTTNDQLLQAEQALSSARENLDSLKNRGLPDTAEIKSERSGLISRVLVQQGTVSPSGAALVEIVSDGLVEVRTAFEPEDIDRIRDRHPVVVRPVNSPQDRPVTGYVRKISGAVDPVSRLADVFVTIPKSSSLMLGEFVEVQITLASSSGFVVPRQSVLEQDGSFAVFSVRGEKAVRHGVRVGIETDAETEIFSETLSAGDPIVILGNYELSDGMPVKVSPNK